MSDNTGIEWCDATWNPVTGCTEVSPGCDHCYAKTFAERFRGTPGHYFERGFDLQLRPEKLDQPLRWRKPRRIFVNSMSDLFHDSVPDEYIARVWAIMALAPQHTFQVLTKRHARMRSLLDSDQFWKLADISRSSDTARIINGQPVLTNVWLGVSTENQQWADIRIPALLETPAAVRFISAEPLLGPIDLSRWITRYGAMRHYSGHYSMCNGESGSCFTTWCSCPCHEIDVDGLHWVIVGGESGRGARPMHPDWARSLRDQCTTEGVPFFFKQWGDSIPFGQLNDEQREAFTARHGDRVWPPEVSVRIISKKADRRVLDGRTWDEYPAVAHVCREDLEKAVWYLKDTLVDPMPGYIGSKAHVAEWSALVGRVIRAETDPDRIWFFQSLLTAPTNHMASWFALESVKRLLARDA